MVFKNKKFEVRVVPDELKNYESVEDFVTKMTDKGASQQEIIDFVTLLNKYGNNSPYPIYPFNKMEMAYHIRHLLDHLAIIGGGVIILRFSLRIIEHVVVTKLK